MQHTVTVFVVPATPPGAPPKPGQTLIVDAPSDDEARSEVRARLQSEGYRVRALSFGATGLVAYVEERSA